MVKTDKKLLLIAQEIKLTKILAGNNKHLRERTIKRLRKWLNDRTASAPISEDAFMRIWKGLFYAMWMSDKPLIQEECAENIAKLVHINDNKVSLLFFKCFLQTMVNEWFGIDYFRLDKFLMLVRRVLRQIFEVLKGISWELEFVEEFREILNQTAFKDENKSSLGLTMHLQEIFFEEIAKVSRGTVSEETILTLLQPFAQRLARLDNDKDIKHIITHIFRYLIRQTDEGIDYKEKFHAWRSRGFPGGSIDAIEKVEVDEDMPEIVDEDLPEEDEDLPKDPRAGKVDVILPQLQFDSNSIADLLEDLKFKPYTTPRARKSMTKIIKNFRDLAQGSFPLGIKTMPTCPDDGYSTKVRGSLKRLQNFEATIAGESKNAKSRKLKKRKMKEIVREEMLKYTTDTPKANGVIDDDSSTDEQVEGEQQSFKDFIASGLFGNEKSVKKTHKTRKHQDDIHKSPDSVRKLEKSPDTIRKLQKSPDSVRKLAKTSDSIRKIQKSLDSTRKIKSPIHSVKQQNKFVRNSGTWLVDDIEKPENPWSQPLRDGETEYFVVSKKTQHKMKALTKTIDNFTNESEIDTVIESSILKQKSDKKKLKHIKNLISDQETSTPKCRKTPNRQSQQGMVESPNLDQNGVADSPKLVKNPFSEIQLLKKKKIKIDLGLNRSQDITEHFQQIMSSPGIPYDAARKPSKPLLKPSPIPSPINPFYRRKMRF